jgi:tetratricopeptide (TPR) repeat protein
MDVVNSVAAESIFVSTATQQSQLEELANRALSNGIDLYMRKDYEGAAKEFQRSIGLAPQSQYAVDASNYMANAYLQLNQPEKAIQAYKTSISLNPYRDDTHIILGNLYFSEKRYRDAENEYKQAIRLNPTENNYYSLGQAYLELGQYNAAKNQFNTVKHLAPESPNGNFGLGLVCSRQGDFEEAIRQFKKAIGIENELYDAYAEMGYAYADLGQMDKAQEQVDSLKQERPGLAEMLSLYMNKVDSPKFMFAYSTDFMYMKSVKTQVSALDSYLANANTSKTFTLKFSFSKEMDRDSVEDRFNWKISRASGGGPGQAYNFGMPVPSTEISLSPYPDYVFYDSETLTATVYFTIHQNASADGTIDPSHIEFKFNGEDRYGYPMDPERDQFSGFSKVA